MNVKLIIIVVFFVIGGIVLVQVLGIFVVFVVGQVGEQVDGFFGVCGMVLDGVCVELESINIKCCVVYIDLVGQCGVMVKDVVVVVGCIMFKICVGFG